jgi:HlyD family secretion protein
MPHEAALSVPAGSRVFGIRTTENVARVAQTPTRLFGPRLVDRFQAVRYNACNLGSQMAEEPRKIFRDQALEHLSSPEQLDQLLQVVHPKSWIPILTLGALLLAASLWSVFGRIPMTVEGVGLLVYPRHVVSLQLPSPGQVVELNIKVGDFVRKGQVLGKINQPALQQNLDQDRIRLTEAQQRNGKLLPLRERRTALEKQANEKERRQIEQRIEFVERSAESQRAKNETYFTKKRESLEELQRVKLELDENLRQRYEGYQELRKEGLVSNDSLLSVRQDYMNNQAQLRDFEVQMRDMELQQVRAEQSYQEQLDLAANLRTQLTQLDAKSREIDQQHLETTSDNDLRIQEIEREIARYEEDLKTKSQIVSEYSGRILEVIASVGQIVNAGQRLGAIEADPNSQLLAVAYFQVSDGKKIEPGMEVRITPATIERERYGGIVGKIVSVSPFPVTTDAITNVVGNAEVAQSLSAGGSKIEVFAELGADPSSPTGYRWTSGRGPDIKVTAGTTGVVRATVEDRRPIALVIPILRRWSGT